MRVYLWIALDLWLAAGRRSVNTNWRKKHGMAQTHAVVAAHSLDRKSGSTSGSTGLCNSSKNASGSTELGSVSSAAYADLLMENSRLKQELAAMIEREQRQGQQLYMPGSSALHISSDAGMQRWFTDVILGGSDVSRADELSDELLVSMTIEGLSGLSPQEHARLMRKVQAIVSKKARDHGCNVTRDGVDAYLNTPNNTEIFAEIPCNASVADPLQTSLEPLMADNTTLGRQVMSFEVNVKEQPMNSDDPFHGGKAAKNDIHVEKTRTWKEHLEYNIVKYSILGVFGLWVFVVSFWYCCCNGVEYITTAEVSWEMEDSPTNFKVWMGYLIFMPMHLMRAVFAEDTSSENSVVASSLEQKHLWENRHVFSNPVFDFIARRRSIMVVAMLFVVSVAAIQVWEFIDSFALIKKYETWADIQPLNYGKFVADRNLPTEGTSAFIQFTKYVIRGMVGSILKSSAVFNTVGEGLEALLSVLSAIALAMALNNWDRYYRSFKWVRLAWVLSLMAPFLITVIPLREFMEWDGIDALARQYNNELQIVTQGKTEAFARQAIEGCQQIQQFRREGKLQQAVDAIQGVCEKIKKYTPNRHVKCCWVMNVIDAPFDKMHDACNKADAAIKANVGKIEKALEIADQKVCVAFSADFNRIADEGADSTDYKNAFQATGADGAAKSPFLQNTMLTGMMKQMITFGISLATGLKCFNAMMPAAVSIAPSIIRGAFIVKSLVPQSSIPGIFILLLPCLYCPFVWSVYSIVYQLVGENDCSKWLFPGLLVVALGPMMFTLVGMYLNVPKPMHDEQSRIVFRRMSVITWTVNLAGYACLGYWAFLYVQSKFRSFVKGKGANEFAFWTMQQFASNALFVVSVFCNVVAKYFLTTCAGADFMVEQIADQWMYDLEMERHEREYEMNKPIEGKDEEDWDENAAKRDMATNRVERLDCLVWIKRNSMQPVVENINVGSKKRCREHYLPTGGAYHYSEQGFGAGSWRDWSQNPHRVNQQWSQQHPPDVDAYGNPMYGPPPPGYGEPPPPGYDQGYGGPPPPGYGGPPPPGYDPAYDGPPPPGYDPAYDGPPPGYDPAYGGPPPGGPPPGYAPQGPPPQQYGY